MAVYPVNVPDLQSPQVNPYLGMYQDGYGSALAGMGNDLARVSNAMDGGSGGSSNALAMRRYMDEQRAKMGIAEWAIESIGMGMENAIPLLSNVADVPLTEGEVSTLQGAARDSAKLDQVDLQRPNRAMNQLRRAAHLRESIARSPLIAEELFKIYKTGTGAGVLDELESITTQAEDARAAYIQDIETTNTNLGGNPNATFQQKAEFVTKHRTLLRNKAESDARWSMLSNQEKTDRAGSMRDMRTNHIPALVAGYNSQIQATLNSIGGNVTSLSPDQRVAFTQQITEAYNRDAAELRQKYTSSELTDADYQAALAPVTAIRDNALRLLSGEATQEAVDTSNKIIGLTATNEFLTRNPDAAQAMAVFGSMKDIPDILLTPLAQLEGVRAAAAVIAPIISKEMDRVTQGEIVREAQQADPVNFKSSLREGRVNFQNIAAHPSTTPEGFNNMIMNTFSEYGKDPALDQMFNEWLPALASPEVLARLNQMGTAETISALDNGMRQYVQNMADQVSARVQQRWGTSFFNPQVTPAAPNPGGYPAPAGARVNVTLFNNTMPYIKATYRKDGMPVFTAAPDVPADAKAKVQATLRDLNAIAPRIKDVVQLSVATDMVKFPPEVIAETLVTRGQFPEETLIEEQKKGAAKPAAEEKVTGIEFVDYDGLL